MPIVMGVPKPPKRVKNRKTKEWDSVRRELKQKFLEMGITSCELGLEKCTRDNYLGFAHTAKRRKLSHEDLYEVALLCNNCHEQIEYGTSEIMAHTIRMLIAKRI